MEHLTSLTNCRRAAEIHAGLVPLRLGYEGLLTQPIYVSETGQAATKEGCTQHFLEMVFLVEQEFYQRNLLNQTFSHSITTGRQAPGNPCCVMGLLSLILQLTHVRMCTRKRRYLLLNFIILAPRNFN